MVYIQDMTYATVSVVVDGALESEDDFTDYLLLDQFIDEVRDDAQSHGYPTEVYIVEHEHDMNVEDCACVQYLTDHHPAFSWNVKD